MLFRKEIYYVMQPRMRVLHENVFRHYWAVKLKEVTIEIPT